MAKALAFIKSKMKESTSKKAKNKKYQKMRTFIKPFKQISYSISLLLLSLIFTISCKKEIAPKVDNTNLGGIRQTINYNNLTASTPYKSLFLDNKGDTTVNLLLGETKHKMFIALNYYLGAAARDNKATDSSIMRNLFANTNSPFTDIPSLKILGSDLNNSSINLRDLTSSSMASESQNTKTYLNNLFGHLSAISSFVNDTAVKGKAGKLGNYLVDEQGIETAQIIQKTMIGATQVDYICNVLLDKGLEADNKTIISGKNYTQLEQNWDEAYGFLTLNSIYLAGSTDAVKGTTESLLGSYIWEYNKEAYAQIYPAFLKGRAAIANNDMNTLKAQANFIRTQVEKALANAAVGYLAKWKSGATDAARAHAIAEGLGFVYSLRYCKLNGITPLFCDTQLNLLVNTNEGFWDLTNAKINTAIAAISEKFNL